MATRWNSKEGLAVIPRANRFEKLNFFLSMADGWPRLVQNFNVNKIPAMPNFLPGSAEVLRNYFRDVHFNTFTMFVGDIGKQQIRINIKDMRKVRIKGLVAGSKYNGSTGKLLKFDGKRGRWGVQLNDKTIAVKPQNFEVVQSDELLKFSDGTVVDVLLSHSCFAPDPVSLVYFLFDADKVRAGDAAAKKHFEELLEIQNILMSSIRASHPENYGAMENPPAIVNPSDHSRGALGVWIAIENIIPVVDDDKLKFGKVWQASELDLVSLTNYKSNPAAAMIVQKLAARKVRGTFNYAVFQARLSETTFTNGCLDDTMTAYDISLDAAADVSLAREPRSGDKVCIQGLASATNYNGKKGKLVELLTKGKSAGRWKVELDEVNAGEMRFLSVKPENLRFPVS
jgi:hypothetical protein